MISPHDYDTDTSDTNYTHKYMIAQTNILNEQEYAIGQEDTTIMNQGKFEDFKEKNYYNQKKSIRKQERIYNSQGNALNNVALHSVEQIKQEQDESIQVKVEYDPEPENECKETIIKSNAEYKQLYEQHIVKDELVIGPEVKQETCTDTNCVPKDEAEHDQHMSEDENYRQRTKQRITNLKKKNKENKNQTKSKAACDLCNKVLSTKYKLNYHIQYHCPMNKNKNKFICDSCNKCYQSKASLVKHIMSKHNNTLTLLKYQINKECNLCKMVFSRKYNRDKHIKYHCPMNKNRTIKPKSQIENVECNLCNKVFTRKDSRDNHIKYFCPMNKNKHMFICDACHKCYQSKATLVQHIISTHRDTMNLVKYQFDCNLCNKVFTRKTYRNSHIQYSCPMNKNKTFTPKCQIKKECNLCNKVFSSKEYRDKHIKYFCPMNKNRTFKPKRQIENVECNLCNKVFTRKDNRDIHIKYSCPMNKNRTFKPKREIGKVKCNLCNMVFSRKYNRDNHIKYHCPMNKNRTFKPKSQIENVECNLCNKVFTRKDSRDNHIKYFCPMNKNKNIFICDACHKCYQSKASLVQHIISTHRDTMNLVKYQIDCNLCSKVFSRKRYRDKHIKYICPMNKNRTLKPKRQIEDVECIY